MEVPTADIICQDGSINLVTLGLLHRKIIKYCKAKAGNDNEELNKIGQVEEMLKKTESWQDTYKKAQTKAVKKEVTPISSPPATLTDAMRSNLPILQNFDGVSSWERFYTGFDMRYGNFSNKQKVVLLESFCTKQAKIVIETLTLDGYDLDFEELVQRLKEGLMLNKKVEAKVNANKFMRLTEYELRNDTVSSLSHLEQLLHKVVPYQLDKVTAKVMILLKACNKTKQKDKAAKLIVGCYEDKCMSPEDLCFKLAAQLLDSHKADVVKKQQPKEHKQPSWKSKQQGEKKPAEQDSENRTIATLKDSNETVKDLKIKFKDVFSQHPEDLGRTNIIKHKIDIGKATPIRSKKRQVALAIKDEFKKIIDGMLRMGVIRKSRSPWASPVILVPKKDKTIRMCVDFRRLNEVIKLDSYPLPNIEQLLLSLHNKKYFSTMDCTKGYWQIELDEESKPITAFTTDYGLFEFNVLPFGLATAPSEFERLVESLFPDIIGKSVFVYVDDILLATETEEEHKKLLELVLTRLGKAKLKINPDKCRLFVSKLDFVGFTISKEGLQLDEAKVKKCLDFAKPYDMVTLQSFLGFVNYFRSFIYDHAAMTKPLYELISKKKFEWLDCQNDAFEKVKSAVKHSPILIQPDIKGAVAGTNPFEIYVDASYQGIGSVLMQKKDGMMRPILFYSRSLKNAENRYHISDLEALALVQSLKRYKNIIYNTRVKAFTDHQSLVTFFKKADLNDRLLRWSLVIQAYDLEIIHIAGKKNVLADCLSRCLKPNQVVDSADDDDVEVMEIIALNTT
uniref:Reverse transcriptase domain-containing protein n=1 Tax=Rhabditophanes sp. KR3021 TaxID=114890 RepID=A0AC35U463_9BILA